MTVARLGGQINQITPKAVQPASVNNAQPVQPTGSAFFGDGFDPGSNTILPPMQQPSDSGGFMSGLMSVLQSVLGMIPVIGPLISSLIGRFTSGS
jgi:hypothetical protein